MRGGGSPPCFNATAQIAHVSALGQNVALHGDRLAAATESGTNRRIDVFNRNQGGADQWGFAGTLAAAPVSEISTHALSADAASGRPAALAIPDFSMTTGSLTAPARLKIFEFTPGTGIGNWTPVADLPIGSVNGYSFFLPGLGFAGDDLIHGLGPADPTGLAASWLASVHRRNPGGANAWQLQQTLAGPGSSSSLGRSIATSGQDVAVGMPNDTSAGLDTGCVMAWYQLKITGGSSWLPIGRFQASVPVSGARFGSSVAVISTIDNTWLAVGAPGETSGRGAVYLFSLNSLYPSTTPLRVAPSSPVLIVGAGFGSSVAFSGKACFFAVTSGGTSLTSFAEFGGTAAEKFGFGTTVAADYSRVVVGNPNYGPGGKTFTYDFTAPGVLTWDLLHTREGSTGDGLGSAVTATTIFTFSAKPWSDLAGTNAGAVVIEL